MCNDIPHPPLVCQEKLPENRRRVLDLPGQAVLVKQAMSSANPSGLGRAWPGYYGVEASLGSERGSDLPCGLLTASGDLSGFRGVILSSATTTT